MDSRLRKRAISRRGLVKGAVGGAGAAFGTGADSRIAAREGKSGLRAGAVTVVATVVRAEHARDDPGRLTLGIRASVSARSTSRRGVVLVTRNVDFDAPAPEILSQIEAAIQDRVASLLSTSDERQSPADITVRVFGGPW